VVSDDVPTLPAVWRAGDEDDCRRGDGDYGRTLRVLALPVRGAGAGLRNIIRKFRKSFP